MVSRLNLILPALGILLCVAFHLSTGLALALGILLAISFPSLDFRRGPKIARYLLQVSVVALGIGIPFYDLMASAASGIMVSIVTIALVLSIGSLLGRLLKLELELAWLISAGTAICGGSAIAAVAASIGASSAHTAMSLGAVFLLNAIALYVFPIIGHALDLSQLDFGTWSGLAIHDIASVVGAASSYGEAALLQATTVKLSRVLWIAPIALLSARLFAKPEQDKARVVFPWFILGFLFTSWLASTVEAIALHRAVIADAAKMGFSVTLFLIGLGLSRETLRQVGPKTLLHAFTLWLLASVGVLLWLKFL